MDYVDVIEGLIGESIAASGTDVLQADVSQYMSEGLQTIVNVLPEDMMWMLEANTKEYTEATAEHGASIGTNKILYVQRLSDSLLVDSDGDTAGVLDSKMLVECREVSPALRGRVKAGSGWKEEASETDPVYYKLDKKIFIEPPPTDYRASGSEIGAVATITKTESGSTGFTVDGTYTGSGRKGYIVEVQDSQDSIDRFKWSDDDGSTYSTNTPTNKMPHADYQKTFAGDAGGWLPSTGSTFTFPSTNGVSDGYGRITWASQSSSWIYKTGLSISGQDNRYVHMRIKASHKTAHPSGKLYGRLYFSTAALNSGNIDDWVGYKAFTITAENTWQETILDMHDLTQGGTNYENNVISGFRLHAYTGTADDETFDIDWFAAGSGATATSNGLSNGINITWADGNTNHAAGDKYEFQVNESPRSKVYYISVPPSGWVYNSDYLDGTVPNEVDPIVLNYVVMRALEKKLAKIQNGSSASLEQYIIDEDLDLAQGQQILIQDTNALIDRFAREYQMGLQSLMAGTYKGKTTDDRKEKQAYQNVAQ